MNRGYVLLAEVLLGLTIVLIALLAVFQLFFTADSTVALADRTAQANQVARRHLEQELNRSYNQVASFQGEERVAHGVRRGNSLSTDFAYSIDVQELDPAKKIKQVAVTVTWGNEHKHTVSMASSKGELW